MISCEVSVSKLPKLPTIYQKSHFLRPPAPSKNIQMIFILWYVLCFIKDNICVIFYLIFICSLEPTLTKFSQGLNKYISFGIIYVFYIKYSIVIDDFTTNSWLFSLFMIGTYVCAQICPRVLLKVWLLYFSNWSLYNYIDFLLGKKFITTLAFYQRVLKNKKW